MRLPDIQKLSFTHHAPHEGPFPELIIEQDGMIWKARFCPEGKKYHADKDEFWLNYTGSYLLPTEPLEEKVVMAGVVPLPPVQISNSNSFLYRLRTTQAQRDADKEYILSKVHYRITRTALHKAIHFGANYFSIETYSDDGYIRADVGRRPFEHTRYNKGNPVSFHHYYARDGTNWIYAAAILFYTQNQFDKYFTGGKNAK